MGVEKFVVLLGHLVSVALHTRSEVSGGLSNIDQLAVVACNGVDNVVLVTSQFGVRVEFSMV